MGQAFSPRLVPGFAIANRCGGWRPWIATRGSPAPGADGPRANFEGVEFCQNEPNIGVNRCQTRAPAAEATRLHRFRDRADARCRLSLAVLCSGTLPEGARSDRGAKGPLMLGLKSGDRRPPLITGVRLLNIVRVPCRQDKSAWGDDRTWTGLGLSPTGLRLDLGTARG
jgi:hypothetical protein